MKTRTHGAGDSIETEVSFKVDMAITVDDIIAFDNKTGEALTPVRIYNGVGDIIAAQVLPGATAELVDKWYGDWMEQDGQSLASSENYDDVPDEKGLDKPYVKPEYTAQEWSLKRTDANISEGELERRDQESLLRALKAKALKISPMRMSEILDNLRAVEEFKSGGPVLIEQAEDDDDKPETLGEIRDKLLHMTSKGVTVESIQYALDRLRERLGEDVKPVPNIPVRPVVSYARPIIDNPQA